MAAGARADGRPQTVVREQRRDRARQLRRRRREIGGAFPGRELADVEDDPTAAKPETVAQRLDLPGRGRRGGRRDVVDRLNASHALEETRAPVNVEDPLAHTDDAVDTT